MANLKKQIGTDKNYIELSVKTGSDCDFGYDEVKATVYKNGKYAGDFTEVFNDAGLLTDMVDSIDWNELYMETVYNKKEVT